MPLKRKPIQLHWASSKPNFGDALSPLICEMVSQRAVVLSSMKQCDLVSIGSLLQRKKENLFSRAIFVWGTGFIEAPKPHKSKHIFCGVRGRKTEASIINIENVSYGDPGLLCSELLNSKQSNLIYEWGIVPHYKDRNSNTIMDLAKRLPGSKIIDVFNPPLETLKEISQCNRILSSSLHGLIAADALNISNGWIMPTDQIRGGTWKFEDYYSAFENYAKSPIINQDLLSDCSIVSNLSAPAPEELQALQQGLFESFPNAI